MHAFILIVEFIVVTSLRIEAEKITHLVLVKRERATVGVGVLIVFVIFTALTAWRVLYAVFRKVHRLDLKEV